jgi:hypothetical protein
MEDDRDQGEEQPQIGRVGTASHARGPIRGPESAEKGRATNLILWYLLATPMGLPLVEPVTGAPVKALMSDCARWTARRRVEGLVSARAWGFKSPLRHEPFGYQRLTTTLAL